MDIGNIQWIETAKGRASQSADSYARVSYCATGKRNKGLSQLVLTIYKPCMKEMRWLAGDRVQIGDAGDYFAVRRVPDNGLKLTPSSNGIGEAESKEGRSVTVTVSVTRADVQNEVDKHHVHKDDVVIQDGMLIIPKRESTTKESKQ